MIGKGTGAQLGSLVKMIALRDVLAALVPLLFLAPPGFAQTATSSADAAYIEALHQYDRADIRQSAGYDAFNRQVRVASDRGNRDAQAIVAATSSATNGAELIERFKPLADAGNVVAETFVGSSYANGDKPDFALALKFLRSAASKPVGGSQAQLELGVMYSLGKGTPANELVARRWLKKSAAAGNPQAQRLMAQLESEAAQQAATAQQKDELARDKCKNFAPSAQFGCQLLMRR